SSSSATSASERRKRSAASAAARRISCSACAALDAASSIVRCARSASRSVPGAGSVGSEPSVCAPMAFVVVFTVLLLSVVGGGAESVPRALLSGNRPARNLLSPIEHPRKLLDERKNVVGHFGEKSRGLSGP